MDGALDAEKEEELRASLRAKRAAARESEAASKKPKKPVNDFWSLGLKAAVAHDPTLRHLPQLVADLAEVPVAVVVVGVLN